MKSEDEMADSGDRVGFLGGGQQAPSPPANHIISYQKFKVRPLLREPRPWVHYKSQPKAKTPRVKNKTKMGLDSGGVL